MNLLDKIERLCGKDNSDMEEFRSYLLNIHSFVFILTSVEDSEVYNEEEDLEKETTEDINKMFEFKKILDKWVKNQDCELLIKNFLKNLLYFKENKEIFNEHWNNIGFKT